MTQLNEADLEGSTVYGPGESKIGKVTAVYYDDETSKPEWVAVSTGMFGSKEALIPLAAVSQDGDKLTTSLDKDTVKNAPHHDPDGELTPTQEAELFSYYKVPYAGATVTATGAPETRTAAQADGDTGYDTSGPTTDDAMTRSEERLQVGTQTVETGRVRLRKHVVTENVTQTVPVSHEEIRLEREPITADNLEAATDGPAISEEEHEIVLHGEEPVVTKDAVPVERVRLGTTTVTDERDVSATVRKEQIETDDDSRH